MTRQQFISDITTWNELLFFCQVYELVACEDIIHRDNLQGYIVEDMEDHARKFDWTEIREYLNNITTGYVYYKRGGSFIYEAVYDGDFQDYKCNVLDECDDREIWDVEDETIDPFEEDKSDTEEPYLMEADFVYDDLLELLEKKL